MSNEPTSKDFDAFTARVSNDNPTWVDIHMDNGSGVSFDVQMPGFAEEIAHRWNQHKRLWAFVESIAEPPSWASKQGISDRAFELLAELKQKNTK
jgi:hypothetical protein